MAQRQDLAVERFHGVERLLEQELLLGAGGGLVVVAPAAAQQMGGQRDRGGLGQGAAVERDIAADVGAQPLLVKLRQHCSGDLAEPEERVGPPEPASSPPRRAASSRTSLRTPEESTSPSSRPSSRRRTVRRSRSLWRSKSAPVSGMPPSAGVGAMTASIALSIVITRVSLNEVCPPRKGDSAAESVQALRRTESHNVPSEPTATVR